MNSAPRPNPEGILARLASSILKYRIPVLLLILALGVGGMIYSATHMKTDNSVIVWFSKDDPHLVDYDDFLKRFPSDEFVMAAIYRKNIFNQKIIDTIRRLSSLMAGDPLVDKVISLTTIDRIINIDDSISVKKLVPQGKLSPAQLREIKKEALTNRLFVDRIISRKGNMALIVGKIKTKPRADGSMHKLTLEEKSTLRNRLEATFTKAGFKIGKDIHLSGIPIVGTELDRASKKDNKIFFGAISIILFIFLMIVFRRPDAAIASMAVFVCSLFSTLCLYYLMGNTFNMIMALLPALLAAIGIADAVHILSHYNEEIARGEEKKPALKKTMLAMWRPCLFTSLTTGIGFASFTSSDIIPIRLFGLFSALGIALAFVFSLTLVPSAVSLFPPPKIRVLHQVGKGWFDGLLARLAGRIIKNYKLILLILVPILGLIVTGMVQLKTETTSLLFLHKNNPVRKSVEFISEQAGGVAAFELMLRGKKGIFKEPRVLKAMDRLQAFIRKQKDTVNVLSVVDYLKEVNFRTGGKPEHFAIPKTRGGVAELIITYESAGGGELSDFLSSDYAWARILVRVGVIGSGKATKLSNRITNFIKTELKELPRTTFTGLVPLYVRLDKNLVTSQIQSVLIAFGAIFLLMCLLLRSVKLGLISMVPNLMPIGLIMGIMGWAKIQLDVATVMIAGVAIGIAVDDTIHFLTRFRRELDQGCDYEDAIIRTTRTIGRPIIFTSVILMAGFMVLMLGSFIPTVRFGYLTGVTMIFALLGDLIVLPALLLLFKPLSKNRKGR